MKKPRKDFAGDAVEGKVIVGVNQEGEISVYFSEDENAPAVAYMNATEALALAKRLLQAAAGARLIISNREPEQLQ